MVIERRARERERERCVVIARGEWLRDTQCQCKEYMKVVKQRRRQQQEEEDSMCNLWDLMDFNKDTTIITCTHNSRWELEDQQQQQEAPREHITLTLQQHLMGTTQATTVRSIRMPGDRGTL